MVFQSLSPIIATGDMDRSVAFYVEVLGFTCGMRTTVYANLQRDGVRLMLAAPNAHELWTGAKFTGQLYMQLGSPKQVDALWEAIRERVDAIYPPDDFAYGMREFGIRDDNGYQLTFGSPVGARSPASGA